MKAIRTYRARIIIFLSLLALFSGCGTSGKLSEPIGKYRVATQEVVSTSREYFLNMNRIERNYNFTLVYTENKPVDGLVTNAIFSAEGIKARINALAIIDSYSTRLAEIVGLNVNENLKKNSEALGKSLKDLGTTVQSISGDSTIASYSDPVVALVKYVASMWIEQKRKEALETAINNASPEVSKILTLLENDLQKAHDDRKESAFIKYNELRMKYNKDKEEKGILNDNDRKKVTIQRVFAHNRYERTKSGNSP